MSSPKLKEIFISFYEKRMSLMQIKVTCLIMISGSCDHQFQNHEKITIIILILTKSRFYVLFPEAQNLSISLRSECIITLRFFFLFDIKFWFYETRM